MPVDSVSNPLGLWITAENSGEDFRVVAAVLPEIQKSPANIKKAFLRPLTELVLPQSDSLAAASFFAQKIVENLRTQYVAQLNITSRPDSALIRSNRGLEGRSPLEWVLPLGNLHVSVSKSGYLTQEYDLDLNRPGEHTATLPLVKRRFYHSRLFPFSLGFVATAMGAYYLQNDYYTQYHQLGAVDRNQRPEEFGRVFKIAQNWERTAGASLAAALLTFGLSFRF